MKKGWTWLMVAGLVALVGALAWQLLDKDEQAPQYLTAQAQRGDLEVTISAAGKIAPKETVTVGAQVSGQLMELLVEPGDEVSQGQLLARIDATIAQTNVEASRAQLLELQASQRQQQATLELAGANAARAAFLFENDAMALSEYEAAKADHAVAAARLDAIAAQIARQTSTLRAQQATLGFTNIYAPISGTVVSVQAVEGQTLNANQTAPTILTLADLTVMTVQTDVSEADVLRVRPGQEAWFSTLGDPERRWRTSVRQILPTPEILNDVVLYKALLDVDNPEGLLKPQMTAQVFFLTGSARDTVLVPITALRPGGGRRAGDERVSAEKAEAGNDGGRRALAEARRLYPDSVPSSVMVVTQGSPPVSRPVLVGLRTRTQAQILHGLEPGEVVVTGEPAPGARGQAGGDRRGRVSAGPASGMRRF